MATEGDACRPPHDALTVWADRFGCSVQEMADMVLQQVDKDLREGRFEPADAGLVPFRDADPGLLRPISGTMRRWAEDPERRAVRGRCLGLVVMGEGADAFPFVESFLHDGRTTPTDRKNLLSDISLVMESAGHPWQNFPRLSPEARKDWDAFLRRFIEHEKDPGVIRKADEVMRSVVDGWWFSEERFDLFERRARDCEATNPGQARHFRRIVENGRKDQKNGITNVVMCWRVPFQPASRTCFPVRSQEEQRLQIRGSC